MLDQLPPPNSEPSPDFAEHTLRVVAAPVREDFRKILIDYIDIKPRKIEIRLPFVEYFERIKRHKADGWQIDFCGRLENAFKNRDTATVMAAIHAEAQLGKPLSVETLVLMADGSYKRLGDVEVGDVVITHLGRPRKVLQVFEQGELDCLDIRTNCGRSVTTALDHPFLTPEGWTEAKDLVVDQALGCVPESQISATRDRTNDDFELLGYYLGDGCVTAQGGTFQSSITSGDPEQTARIIEIATRMGFGYRIHQKAKTKAVTIALKGGVRDWIRSSGIAGSNSWTKRVPAWAFCGSQEQIGYFLGAYFSCDGTFGRQRNTVIDFGSVSIGLLQDIQKLLLRVGIQSRLAIKNGVYQGARHQSHRLYFCSQDFVAQFIEKVPIAGRKGVELKAMLKIRKTFQPSILTDNIVSIEPAGKHQCRCIEVEEDHTFTANDLIVHNSTILAQAYPAYILGHDPLHRVALATYNVSRSQTHSRSVIQIMNLPVHKTIFPEPAGFVNPNASKEKWSTEIRRTSTDAQDSFNPVGLQSGLTGSGFDTLIIDDPYADQKEAFSETVRKNLQEFWDYTVMSRIGTHANVFGMFHRYHVEDLAGYLLNTKTFDYWRYATICDGPYIHDETGQRFEDPLGRKEGEYISPDRRPPSYYVGNQKNKRVWNSMFQGRPSSEEGEFFNIGKLIDLDAIQTRQFLAECKIIVRSWDNAATEEGGDYSVGFQLGMKADGTAIFVNVKRAQVDTAGRLALQRRTAEGDGADTLITVPEDPGSGGKDAVEYVKEKLKGFPVTSRKPTGSKEDRARPLSDAVNSGMIYLGSESGLDDDDKWHKPLKTEFRNFPLSEHDDIVDAGSDAYNEAFSRISKGRVIKNYSAQSNLVLWDQFAARYRLNGKPLDRVPANWTIYAGIKVTPEANTANSAVIVARAAMNTGLDDTLFIIAEYKDFTDDVEAAFEWLDVALETYCSSSENATVWLHPDSASYRQTIVQKLKRQVAMFTGEPTSGISEMDWYLSERDTPSPFNSDLKATGMYGLIADPEQLLVAVDEFGLRSARQEFATWNYTDKGEPSAVGAVLECLRMICYCFRTVPAELSRVEKIEAALGESIRTQAIKAETNPAIVDQLLTRRMIELQSVEQEIDRPVRNRASRFGRR